MSMKKILMAAAAVTALTAGVANAATIDNTTKIAGVDLVPAGTTITSNPFTIACEYIAICLPAFSMNLVNREEK